MARRVVANHAGIDAGLRRVFRIREDAAAEATADEPVKLLEVNADSYPSGVLPLVVPASPRGRVCLPVRAHGAAARPSSSRLLAGEI